MKFKLNFIYSLKIHSSHKELVYIYDRIHSYNEVFSDITNIKKKSVSDFKQLDICKEFIVATTEFCLK
jgi:hypothetical protein